MLYAILCYHDEDFVGSWSKDQDEAVMKKLAVVQEKLTSQGRLGPVARLLPTTANGCPAFGQYRVDPAGGHAPWALQVLEISDGRIAAFNAFLDTSLFAAFGLPSHLPVQSDEFEQVP